LKVCDELHEPLLGSRLASALAGVAHRLVRRRMQLLLEVAKGVASLVFLAALHQRALAEAITNRFCKRLAPVDDEQVGPMRIEAPFDEVIEQCPAHLGVLGGSEPHPERVFLARFVDAEGDEHRVLPEAQPVEHQRHERQLRQVPSEPRIELALRRGRKAAARRTLARPVRAELLRQRLD